MARPLRLEFAGALYHITARGDRREPIYDDDHDRLVFLDLMAEVCQQCHWVCHAYCLMGNHYHLLIETPEPNLSSGMRQLNGVYTQKYNRRHGRVGHVFQGRYKAILVEKESYLLELARYIVLNPVRARMVRSAEEWPWSSYRATVGVAEPSAGLFVDWVLSAFGNDREQAVAGYKQFVASASGQPAPWEKLKNQIYLGSDQFIAKVQANIDPAKPLAEIPVQQRRREPLPLAAYFQRMPDRDAAIVAAYASGGYSLKSVGDYVGLHYSRVSRIVRKAKGKTSYIESATQNQEATSDRTAEPVEAGKTLGVAACGSDKPTGSLSRSSNSKGNLGQAIYREPGYEGVIDE